MSKQLDRSAKSLERVFDAIREVHAHYPDMRVGQIIVNACVRDPFYIENDELALKLVKYLDLRRADRRGDCDD